MGRQKHAGDESMIALFNNVIAECFDIFDMDLCELGEKLNNCVIQAAPKHGYVFGLK